RSLRSLYCCSHGVRGRGAPMTYLSHKASFHSRENNTPSNPGTKHEIEAVIPAKSNRRTPVPHDRTKYCWRNLVERLFNKLKNWRRIATRYDKTKESYPGFVSLVSALQWIPFVHET
ncbi:hypothetical protein LOC54_02210, partial [Acetobacter sp. AN02]|nr:hypothetical protein [Acetobacter sp. AN02]